MSAFRKTALLALTASLASTVLVVVLPVAKAQEASSMSCDQLWYARNKIYARNGYCFKTDRAREVFGAGCFPPYGQLNGWEQKRVLELQSWEQRNGCGS